MRAASATLIGWINALRVAPDAQAAFADCYAFTLAGGVSLYWSSTDYPVTFAGNTYACTGPLVSGLKYSCKVGLEVDRQQITIAARPTDLISGAPILQMIRDGAFDGATVARYRVCLYSPGGPVVDGVLLFHGRVSTVDLVGRTYAKITVASDLVVLDYDMPHNLFSTTCNHVLYDSGCGLSASAFSTNGAAASGSTATQINWTGAILKMGQGKLLFTSGANDGVAATVKSVSVGASLALMYPLPETPSPGDAFVVYDGCDHTLSTCGARFSNQSNFRGFPFVPPPQLAY